MKNLDFALLLDIYGSMLTDKQRNAMELYYWEDLSLREIANSQSVTRQAVHDGIKRSELLLAEYEEKLHLGEKIKLCMKKFDDIYELAQKKDDFQGCADRIMELAKEGSEIF